MPWMHAFRGRAHRAALATWCFTVRWIVASCLKFRLLVVLIAAGLMVFGVARLRNAPADVLPEYTLPYVEIQTESLGLSAAEVEQMITVPMEQDLLNGVEGVKTIRSDSVPGLSSIVLVFDRGTDLLRARQLVQERVSQPHAFPSVSKPPLMLQPRSATGRVMMIGLSSKRLSPIQLSVLARWTVRPRLMGVPGVANVAIWGQRDRQLQVLVDPERLRDHDVSLAQVIRTTGNAQLVSSLSFLDASTPGTGGFVDGPNQRLGVRHVLPFGAPDDLAQVPIERTSYKLGDVARVAEDHQPLIGDAEVGERDGLVLVVEKLPGTGTLELTRRLDEALDELRAGLTGVRIDATVFRPASYVHDAIGNLTKALLIAGALLLAALALLLREWRAVVVGLVAMALSLVAAVLALDLGGGTINALTIAGLVIALALVIDDAVSGTEDLRRRLSGRERSAADTISEATVALRGPLGYATLIVLLAMAPVFFMPGLTGAFLHPMALAYGAAVLASMVVALTVTPALALLLYSRASSSGGEPALGRRIRDGYAAGLARIIRTPRPALLALSAIALLGVGALALLRSSLPPAFHDRQLLVHWNAASGTSLPEMKRITARAGNELAALPGVEDVGAHVGRAVTGDQVVGTGSGELWVRLDRGADYDAAVASVRRVVRSYPGLRGEVETYEQDRTAGVLQPPHETVDVRVYGEDYGVMRAKAEQLRAAIAHVDGVHDPRVVQQVEQPSLQISVNLKDARRHGIKPGDVRRAAAVLISGIEVGNFFERQKVFDVVVRGVPDARHSLTSAQNLLLDTPDGDHVRLRDVADVSIRPSLADIRHEAVSRYVDVRAGVAGRDAGAVRQDIERRIATMPFPLEYHAELLPPDQDAAGNRPVSLTIAAAIGIFLLLQAAFASWRLALLVFATAPVGLVGGLIVALIGGRLSLGELLGLFALLGLAVRAAIVLICHLQRLQREAAEPIGPDLVVRGAAERLAPVLMTVATTALALTPLVVLGNVPGNEITHPMAAVILGGLVTTTLFAVFIVPALYLHFGSAGASFAFTETSPTGLRPALRRRPDAAH